MIPRLMVVCVFGALAVPPLPVAAENAVPEISMEGLELVEKDRRGEIYADPGIDWGTYDRIMLEEATVAFRKNWQRDQNRTQPFKIQTKDMERIKSELSDLFGEVFARELADGGYVMATETAENVLRITPHIVDLDVYAPDTRGSASRTTTYAEQAGRMTLRLDIFDAVTGDLIARASDRQEAPRRGYMQWTTSATNRAEAQRMIQKWAREFRERLDEARGG